LDQDRKVGSIQGLQILDATLRNAFGGQPRQEAPSGRFQYSTEVFQASSVTSAIKNLADQGGDPGPRAPRKATNFGLPIQTTGGYYRLTALFSGGASGKVEAIKFITLFQAATSQHKHLCESCTLDSAEGSGWEIGTTPEISHRCRPLSSHAPDAPSRRLPQWRTSATVVFMSMQ